MSLDLTARLDAIQRKKPAPDTKAECKKLAPWVRRESSIEKVAARFWKHVACEASSVCWLWSGFRDKNGYGRVWTGKRPISATRVAWLLMRGAIPSGMFVCHTCDVPACVNPAHLFLGTASDNTRDSVAKGRWRDRGAAIPKAIRMSRQEDRNVRA